MSRHEPLGRRTRLKRVLLALAFLLAALLAWVAFDLYAPRRTSLRDFDPDEVARLETAMWRSYYSRERLRLFRQLAELMRTQYRMPFWRSNAAAFRAAQCRLRLQGRSLAAPTTSGRSQTSSSSTAPSALSYRPSTASTRCCQSDVVLADSSPTPRPRPSATRLP